MSGIVILIGQVGIALTGFVGMAKVMTWYHGGGKKSDKNNNKFQL